MRHFNNLRTRILAAAVGCLLLTSCGALWSVSDDSYMYPGGYYGNYGYGPPAPPIIGNGPGSIGMPPPPPPPPANNPGYNPGFNKPQPGNPGGGNGPQNPIPDLPPTGNPGNQNGGYRPAISNGGNGGNGGNSNNSTPPNYGRH